MFQLNRKIGYAHCLLVTSLVTTRADVISRPNVLHNASTPTHGIAHHFLFSPAYPLLQKAEEALVRIKHYPFLRVECLKIPWQNGTTRPIALLKREAFLYHSLPVLRLLVNCCLFAERPILNAKNIEKARILESHEQIPSDPHFIRTLQSLLSTWLTHYREWRAAWFDTPTALPDTFQFILWKDNPSADQRAFVPLEEWYIRLHTVEQACWDHMTTALHHVPFDPLADDREDRHSLTTGGKYHQILKGKDAHGNEWILKSFHFQEHSGGYISSGVLPHLSHLIGRNVVSYRLGELICPGMVVETHPCLIAHSTNMHPQIFSLGIRMSKARGIPFSYHWKPKSEQDTKLTKLERDRGVILHILNQLVESKEPNQLPECLRKSAELRTIFTSQDDPLKKSLPKQWQQLPSDVKILFFDAWERYQREVQALPKRLLPGSLIRNITRMQWLDALLFQGDRHHRNFYVDEEHENAIQLIDNDQCLGPSNPSSPYDIFPTRAFTEQMGVSPDTYFIYRGSTIAELWARHGGKSIAPLPQIIDETTARNLESCRPETIDTLCDGWLLPSEIDFLKERLRRIQMAIAQLRIRHRVISDHASVWEDPLWINALQYHDPEIPDILFPENMRTRDSSSTDGENATAVLSRYQKLCRERDREQNVRDNLDVCIRLLQSFDATKDLPVDSVNHASK
ncbi:MAG: hypothetical protein LBD40_00985 [Puniceicoccales bacterium]|nr:hypothetical protein [Puniceicoccales bacterium]